MESRFFMVSNLFQNIGRRGRAMLLLFVPLSFLCVFYFFPMVNILGVSFFQDGDLSFRSLTRLVTRGYYAKILFFTVWQAALSTFCTLTAALPGAYVFAAYNFPGKKLIRTITTIPFVLPTVVVASAFQAFLGSRGVANDILRFVFGPDAPTVNFNHSLGFILMAHVFYNYTVVFRIVGGFWAGLGKSTQEAAKMLGASGFTTFRKITLPLLMPAIYAASILVFVFCFSSFGVILILGGPKFSTIEVEIYRQAVHIFNLPMAASLSLVQILFTFILMWVYARLQRKASVELMGEAGDASGKPPETILEKGVVAATILFLGAFICLPLAALLFKSFHFAGGFTLDHYINLFVNRADSVFFVPPVAAVLNSTGIALVTLLLALIIGVPAATYLAGSRGRAAGFLDPLFMLPLSTSAVTLGFGFIVALDEPPLNLRNSPVLVPLAHTLVAFPFVVRSLLPALRSIPASLREAASVMGASPFQVWRHVDLPIMTRALVVGAVFAFTVSIGEFGATVFVARPHMPTMPLAIYRFLGQPGSGNYGQAMAMSSLMMIVTTAGFMIIEKVGGMSGRSPGGLDDGPSEGSSKGSE